MKHAACSRAYRSSSANMRHGVQSRSGFTLIELMITLVIMAILAMLAFRGLSAIIQARDTLTIQQTRLREQTRLIALLHTDLGTLVAPRSASNINAPIWIEQEQNQEKLVLIRDASGPDQPTHFEKIEYLWHKQTIERRSMSWTPATTTAKAPQEQTGINTPPPRSVTLLNQVARIEFQFYAPAGGWLSAAAFSNTQASRISAPIDGLGKSNQSAFTGLALRIWTSAVYGSSAGEGVHSQPDNTAPVIHYFLINNH